MATSPETLAPILPAPAAKPLPTGPNAAEELDAIYRDMGITPLSPEEEAKLPPWSKNAADLFERVINETFEQVEAPEHPL